VLLARFSTLRALNRFSRIWKCVSVCVRSVCMCVCVYVCVYIYESVSVYECVRVCYVIPSHASGHV